MAGLISGLYYRMHPISNNKIKDSVYSLKIQLFAILAASKSHFIENMLEIRNILNPKFSRSITICC